MGRSDLSEAANSSVYYEYWESHAGVTGGIWMRALPARRELEAGTCPPGRGFEGTTQRGQGEVRDAHIPPFPFRFFPRAPISSFSFPLDSAPLSLIA